MAQRPCQVLLLLTELRRCLVSNRHPTELLHSVQIRNHLTAQLPLPARRRLTGLRQCLAFSRLPVGLSQWPRA